MITDEQINAAGYAFFINHGDYFIAVEPLLFGNARLIVSDNLDVINMSWTYDSLYTAVTAMYEWQDSGNDEPSGWFRCPMDGRRRPDGDPEKEFIRF